MELTIEHILEEVEAIQRNFRKLEAHAKNLLQWIRENIGATTTFIQMINSEIERREERREA